MPQPLVDLILFSDYDPTLGARESLELSDALRALGLSCGNPYHCKSDKFPGLLLDAAHRDLCPTLEDDTWALWGRRAKVASSLSNMDTYGGNDGASIAHRIDSDVREALRLLSVSAFLREVQAQYSQLRDAARAQHGKFNARRLKRMRDIFLALSVDLSSTVRGIKQFHTRTKRVAELPVFMLEEPAWLVERYQGATSASPRNYTNMLLKGQKQEVAELASADKDYREILSAVASLGASIDTFKVGRVALWVALLSLAVSMVALLLADVGKHTVLSHLVRFITR